MSQKTITGQVPQRLDKKSSRISYESIRLYCIICIVILGISNNVFAQLQPKPKTQITNDCFNASVYKWKDPYDNSYYPIGYAELSVRLKSSYLSFSVWSDLDKEIWPYYNINYYFKNWVISYNPMKPDIYNYKIQITYQKTF